MADCSGRRLAIVVISYGCCFYLEVAYRYQVDGAQYSGTRISTKPDLYGDRDRDKVLNDFRLRYAPLVIRSEAKREDVYDMLALDIVEQRIPVYYDPKDPQQSYLDITDYDPPSIWTVWVWPGTMAVAGVALCWIALALLMLELGRGGRHREAIPVATVEAPDKTRVHDEAARSPFLDLAFDFNTTSDAQRREELQRKVLASATPEQWAAALRAARALEDHAYDLCDQARDGRHPAESVCAMLREDCPGFSEKSYRKAFNDAMIASR